MCTHNDYFINTEMRIHITVRKSAANLVIPNSRYEQNIPTIRIEIKTIFE